MIHLLFFFLVLFAFSPILLVLLPNIYHKKFFAGFILLTTIKPISFIVVPYLFNPDIFLGSMIYYLVLMLAYYACIFIFYFFFISVFKGQSITPDFRTDSSGNFKGYLVLFLAICLFSILVYRSGGVFLLDPRQGYQHHRSGIGFVWVLYILFVGLSFYYFCLQKKITSTKFILFTYLFFLTGSKQLVLDVFIKLFLFFCWQGTRINKIVLFFSIASLFILMLKMFDQFGASTAFLERAEQYFSFMDLAKLIFDDYVSGELDFQNGSIFLSSFWGYVPRIIYPDKPFAYGSVSLLEMYFPGMAASGHTPSFGMLTHIFVDFGWFAPFFAILLDLQLMTQMLAITALSTNANFPKWFRIGCICLLLIPGFGFHLPILLTIFFAFIVAPKLR